MGILTESRKAELFDYLASRLAEAKFDLSFGGSNWIYHEHQSSEELAKSLEKMIEFEKLDE